MTGGLRALAIILPATGIAFSSSRGRLFVWNGKY